MTEVRKRAVERFREEARQAEEEGNAMRRRAQMLKRRANCLEEEMAQEEARAQDRTNDIGAESPKVVCKQAASAHG